MSIVQSAYNAIRPYLPRKFGVWADVPVRCEALLDAEDYHPDYKRGLMDGIHEHVDDGDVVSLVGAGRGVSTVHCLRAGADRVVAYEAARSMLDVAEETVAIEGAIDRVEWRHALVGEAVEVYGDLAGADVVDPSELGGTDALVLDCEGAERSILDALGDRPPVVVAETHPERGVPTDVTRELLADSGYDVDARRYAPEQDVEGKRVLVGVRDD